LFEMFRDPRYLAPLGVLIAVIFVSAVLAYENSSPNAVAARAGGATVSSAAGAPTPAGAVTDDRRLLDLTKLRDAFLAYRRLHGRFPASRGGSLQTICASDSDAGCALISVAPDAVYADRDQSYWFASDGARVVLVARSDGAYGAAQCPAALPPALSGGPLMCLAFERPVQ